MKEIKITPSTFSELELCPRQFFLKYQRNARYPQAIHNYANELELIERCIPQILSGETNITTLVAHELDGMKEVFKPQTVKSVVKLLTKFSQERQYKGDLLGFNVNFMQEYVLAQDRVQINGLLHQVVKQEDGSIKATIFKGENRFYTNEYMVSNYLPLIYAMAIKQLYNCDKIVINYFMIKHDEEVCIKFNEKEDWDLQKRIVSAHLQKLMEVREEKTVIGSHCAYCPRKSICNDYKTMMIESFEIRNIHELLDIGMDELIKYLLKLENQKEILNDKSEELKNILIHELLNNGKEKAKIGNYEIKIVQKHTFDCDINSVLNVVNSKDHSKIVRIDRNKLKKYLNTLSAKEVIDVEKHCNVRYYNPMLIINETDQESKDKKLMEILKIQ